MTSNFNVITLQVLVLSLKCLCELLIDSTESTVYFTHVFCLLIINSFFPDWSRRGNFRRGNQKKLHYGTMVLVHCFIKTPFILEPLSLDLLIFLKLCIKCKYFIHRQSKVPLTIGICIWKCARTIWSQDCKDLNAQCQHFWTTSMLFFFPLTR